MPEFEYNIMLQEEIIKWTASTSMLSRLLFNRSLTNETLPEYLKETLVLIHTTLIEAKPAIDKIVNCTEPYVTGK